jgi:Ser/Thr protein kinase RdoA (MazF antagonist)
MELAHGEPYARDLERLRDGGELLPRDLARCDALSDALVEIHAERGDDPSLYRRHVRDLVGHGECIMGVLDGYPEGTLDPETLIAIEQECVRWRWRIRGRVERLRRIHGDFHPWNLLFSDEASLTLLDRSRGEYGEPANDVCCIALNWLFFSLQRSGRLEGAFRTLWDRFFARYLERTGDRGLLAVAPPFAVFRLLVMASPAWYPRLPDGVREALLRLARDLLASSRLDPEAVADTVRAR